MPEPIEPLRRPTTPVSALFKPPLRDREAFIDVGQHTKANITRGGGVIADVKFVPERLTEVIAGTKRVNKVVHQSPEPGTEVPLGTTVNLTVVAADKLPIKVFDGVHTALAKTDISVAEVYTRFVATNASLQAVLARIDEPGNLTQSEKALIVTVAEIERIDLTEKPGETIDDFFRGLVAANLFNPETGR